MPDDSTTPRTDDDAHAVLPQLRSFGPTFQDALDQASRRRPVDRPWEHQASPNPEPAARADINIDNHSSAEVPEPEITMLQIDQPQDQRGHRARPALLVAAVVLVIAGAALTRLVNRDEGSTGALSQPETVVASYFESFNAGDADAAMALFAAEVEVTDRFVATRDEWEKLVHWYLAQGAQLTTPACETTANTVDSTTIACAYQNRHAPHLARDLPGVSIQSVFVIESDLIVAFDHGFEATGEIGRSFERWVVENRPENADRIACCTWANIGDAEAAGQLIATYASDWAAG